MKQIYTFVLFCLLSLSTRAQAPFISLWNVSQPATVLVPIMSGPNTNYTINFGDGTVLSGQTGPVSHAYTAAGYYTVTVSGSYDRICFGDYPTSAGNINSIAQWGDTHWSSMQSAFAYCTALNISAADQPDLSGVTDMSYMFRNVSFSLTSYNFNGWDVSNVTNMEGLFQGSGINFSIGNWDVSHVTNMKNMFYQAFWSNPDVQNWNVSNVTNMEGMFSDTAMNRAIGTWDVSHVTNMKAMFQRNEYFNQPLGGWNVSNVTDMSAMFFAAKNFNQPLENWNVSNVTNMSGMFGASTVLGTAAFNQPLNGWDVSHVTDMSSMFSNSVSFNRPLDNWNTAAVTNMSFMFRNADAFNQPLESWNVSHVSNMSYMFEDTALFNQPLQNWDVSNVGNMSYMFQKAVAFNQPLENWNLSHLTNMNYMFSQSFQFNQPLSAWNVSQVTSMKYVFRGNTVFNKPLDNWDVSAVTSMEGMFMGASSFDQDISGWNFNLGPNYWVSFTYFLNNSNMSAANYDALLLKFAQTGNEFSVLGAQSIRYCNPATRSHLVNVKHWSITDAGQGSNCGGNDVVGTVFYDEDANGCDTQDAPVPNFLVHADTGGFDFSSTTNGSGHYQLSVFENSCTLSLLNVPGYFTVSPASPTVNFTGAAEAVNFCLSSNTSVADLNVRLVPTDAARPGFASHYNLVAQNIGTQTVNNISVTLGFDGSKQSFTAASLSPVTSTQNQLTFNLPGLRAFETKRISLTFQTAMPDVVNGGDILDFTAAIGPNANDFTPQDNYFALHQQVVNSFDPNDKSVLQGETVSIDDADQYLDYVIRFQNTGSASAVNVRLLDTLDPKLAWQTFTPVSASHAYTVKITDGNKVEILFENIGLSSVTSNEAGSHGFFAFKIKPVSSVAVNDVISGGAKIFFDFNAPIVTNSVHTTIVGQLGTDTPDFGQLSVYPNPTDDVVNLHLPAGSETQRVVVYSLLGSAIKSFVKNTDVINIADIPAGVYLLVAETDKGVFSTRLLKK